MTTIHYINSGNTVRPSALASSEIFGAAYGNFEMDACLIAFESTGRRVVLWGAKGTFDNMAPGEALRCVHTQTGRAQRMIFQAPLNSPNRDYGRAALAEWSVK